MEKVFHNKLNLNEESDMAPALFRQFSAALGAQDDETAIGLLKKIKTLDMGEQVAFFDLVSQHMGEEAAMQLRGTVADLGGGSTMGSPPVNAQGDIPAPQASYDQSYGTGADYMHSGSKPWMNTMA